MTLKTSLTSSRTSVSSPIDTRAPQRWAAALLMPVGPLCVAILRLVIPYNALDAPDTVIAEVAAHPTAQAAVLWLGLVALFTLVPGAYAVLRLVRPGAPRLAMTAAILLIPGYLGLFGAASGADLNAYVGTRANLDPQTLSQLMRQSSEQPTVVISGLVFLVGHILGCILLGLALWRSAAVHWMWALAMTISQPIHLYAAVTGNHPLDLFAWGLVTVAMAAAAIAVAQTDQRPMGRPTGPMPLEPLACRWNTRSEAGSQSNKGR